MLKSLFTLFYKLPWSGASLDSLTFRRLSLRLVLIMLATMLLAALITLPFNILLRESIVTLAVMLLVGVVGGAVLLWSLYQSIKFTVLRLRYFGVGTLFIVFLLVGAWLLDVIGNGFQQAALFAGNLTMARIAGILFIPSTVLLYVEYFHEVPFKAHKLKPLKVLPASVKGERIGLFLLETFIWFSILYTAVTIILPH